MELPEMLLVAPVGKGIRGSPGKISRLPELRMF